MLPLQETVKGKTVVCRGSILFSGILFCCLKSNDICRAFLLTDISAPGNTGMKIED